MAVINCRQCKYFFVTWDPQTPNGCRLFKIKSRELPSVIVKQAGNGDCKEFELKEHLKKKANDYE